MGKFKPIVLGKIFSAAYLLVAIAFAWNLRTRSAAAADLRAPQRGAGRPGARGAAAARLLASSAAAHARRHGGAGRAARAPGQPHSCSSATQPGLGDIHVPQPHRCTSVTQTQLSHPA